MGSRSRSAGQDAFRVLGRVGGDDQQFLTNSPAGAVAVINRWLREDSEAGVSWLVNKDLPEPIMMAAHLQDQLEIGLAQKKTHLFVFHPGDKVGPKLISRCGLTFDWWALEFATELDMPIGAPCEQCQMLMTGPVPEREMPALPAARAEDDGWNGWARYYTELGWPIVEHEDQLLIDADATSNVVVVTVPIDVAKQVQDELSERDMQAPLLYLPSMPDEALFVASRTPVPVPMPDSVHRLGAPVPLPPSVVADHQSEFYLAWATAPDEAAFDSSNDLRCRDIDVVAAVYKIAHKQRQQQLEQRQRRELTS